MRLKYFNLPLAAVLVAVLALVGIPAGVSQEADPCAAVFEPEEDWSAQAYSYCQVYCVQLDCAGTPAEEDLDTCAAISVNYEELTGGQLPSCEVQP